MQDNGLLSYYREKRAKGEFLSTKDLPIVSTESLLEKISKLNVSMPNNKIMKYYLKPTGSIERDVEILLSQIYAKAGFDTSTYLPILDGDLTKIISDDANGKNTVLAKDFVNNHGFFAFSEVKGSEEYKRNSAKEINGIEIPDSVTVNKSSYTNEVVRQLILTRYFDTASFNDDRHLGNFFYKVENKLDSLKTIENIPSLILPPICNKAQLMVTQMLLSRYSSVFSSFSSTESELGQEREQSIESSENFEAVGVKLIDYGASAYNLYGFKNFYKGVPFNETLKQTDNVIRYFNDFYADGQMKQNISRTGMVYCAKNSEEMQQFIKPNEIAETLGSININEIKTDIEQTLDTKIDTFLTDTLASSFDDLAENLVK